MKVGEVYYNPNGYFSLQVKAINGGKVVMGCDDPRDMDRELKISDIQDWILIKEV